MVSGPISPDANPFPSSRRLGARRRRKGRGHGRGRGRGAWSRERDTSFWELPAFEIVAGGGVSSLSTVAASDSRLDGGGLGECGKCGEDFAQGVRRAVGSVRCAVYGELCALEGSLARGTAIRRVVVLARLDGGAESRMSCGMRNLRWTPECSRSQDGDTSSRRLRAFSDSPPPQLQRSPCVVRWTIGRTPLAGRRYVVSGRCGDTLTRRRRRLQGAVVRCTPRTTISCLGPSLRTRPTTPARRSPGAGG